MLLERLSLVSHIAVDMDGVSLLAETCKRLTDSKGTELMTVDELWPGKIYDLHSQVHISSTFYLAPDIIS